MSDYSGGGAAAAAAALIIFGFFVFVFAVIGYVISAFFLMKIFEKAGVQGKWRAWVPVYNTLVLSKLGDFSPWVMLAAIALNAFLSQVAVIGWLLAVAGYAALILVAFQVNKKLGQDWPLLLLFIFPGLGQLVWLGILAFSSSPWNTNVPPVPWANSFLRDNTVWQGIPVQPSAAPPAAPEPPRS